MPAAAAAGCAKGGADGRGDGSGPGKSVFSRLASSFIALSSLSQVCCLSTQRSTASSTHRLRVWVVILVYSTRTASSTVVLEGCESCDHKRYTRYETAVHSTYRSTINSW